jgi:hypothetical protein
MEPDRVPEACTLPTVERPLRRAEFSDLFALAVSARRISTGHARIVLPGGVADDVRDLAERENACCSFFTFTVTPDDAGHVVFDIEVPPTHVDVLDALAAQLSVD